jgi:hypothetical protein
MRLALPLVALLACGLARASEGVCEEPVKNPLLTFDDGPYIITELNDPEFVPLGTAITYTTKKYDIPCDNGCADLAWHNAESLAEDWLYDRVLWSYAEGSLSEMGFGPLKAMRQNFQRSFVFFIETELHERLTDPERCKASLRARKLVLGHLEEVAASNIYVVKSLDEMLDVSVKLYQTHKGVKEIREGMAG